jgi:hypothetical protein
LERQAVEIVLPVYSESGAGELAIPIMHPLHCLQSRVANVIKLGRRDDTARRQLAAAPIVLREYIAELLAVGEVREAASTLQALFAYLRSDTCGRGAHRYSERDSLETIAAFRHDSRFDQRYRDQNIASMLREIRRRRFASRATRGLIS